MKLNITTLVGAGAIGAAFLFGGAAIGHTVGIASADSAGGTTSPTTCTPNSDGKASTCCSTYTYPGGSTWTTCWTKAAAATPPKVSPPKVNESSGGGGLVKPDIPGPVTADPSTPSNSGGGAGGLF